jgi:hypothetical protein
MSAAPTNNDEPPRSKGREMTIRPGTVKCQKAGPRRSPSVTKTEKTSPRRGRVRNSLSKDGAWMIVEPFAHDELKNNLNPVGRVYYSFSSLLCTPCLRSQEVALCLGAQSGEKRIRELVTAAGFNRFRRAAETPFNVVYEARP